MKDTIASYVRVLGQAEFVQTESGALTRDAADADTSTDWAARLSSWLGRQKGIWYWSITELERRREALESCHMVSADIDGVLTQLDHALSVGYPPSLPPAEHGATLQDRAMRIILRHRMMGPVAVLDMQAVNEIAIMLTTGDEAQLACALRKFIALHIQAIEAHLDAKTSSFVHFPA